MRRGELTELVVMILIPLSMIGFFLGAMGACSDCGIDVCKRERIVDYFPATVLGCELFKKRFK